MYYMFRFIVGLVMFSEISPGQQRAPDRTSGEIPSPPVPMAEGNQQPKTYFYPKMNGEQLVEVYAALTGRRVVLTGEALLAEFRFVQTQPLSPQEALSLLKIACLLEGFIFVPAGPGLDSLTYAPYRGASSNGLGELLPMFTNPEDLPKEDQAVAYVMPLRNIRPEDAKRTFESVLLQQNNLYGKIIAVPQASCVIVIDTTAIIRTLIPLSKRIDLPSICVATAFIKVRHADATELADSLNHLVGSQRRETPPLAGSSRGAPDEGAGERIPVQIVPNPQTSEIFVMGRPVDIAFVEALIQGFDPQTDQHNILRRKLNFLPVAAFLPVARQALERSVRGTGAGRVGGTGEVGSDRAIGGNESRDGSNGSGIPAASSSTAPPLATLAGCTLLVADRITNSIVVQGPPESLQLINRLLDEIDVQGEQVRISCVFGQLSLDDPGSSGIDYLRKLDLHGDSDSGVRDSSGRDPAMPLKDSAAFNPGSLAAPRSDTAVGGLGLYGKIGPDLNAYMQALQTDGRFTVLSRPTITVANNTKGTITSRSKIAVRARDHGNESAGGVTTKVEYRDVDLRLEVVPLVNSATEVTLQIYLLSQDVGENREVGGSPLPDILNRELLTTVTVPDHQTIVLGGFITHRDSQGVPGIPFPTPSSDPGSILGIRSFRANRDELLVFIQPHIGGDNDAPPTGDAATQDRHEIDEPRRHIRNPALGGGSPPCCQPSAGCGKP